jgi:hypothetical protein
MCGVIERRQAPVVRALAMALLLAGCAQLPPPAPMPPGVTRAFDVLQLQGQAHDVEWHVPAAAPRAWVLVQHGFARRCANLRGLAATLAGQGVATLCVNADMARGASPLAGALVAWWLSPAARSPDGRPAPAVAVFSGHSAGGLFAAHAAAAMAPRAPGRVAGVILFDPVGGEGLRAALANVPTGRTHASLAPPAPCNAHQQALPALQAVAAALHTPAQATHIDAEGEDSDSLAVRACREGPPQAHTVAALRNWTVQVMTSMLR